ncbi:SRPBCC domain-containing protein [Aestuariivirga sp. YIM B02566]|uniref:SRPBCC domain-containing protein n=1 Tax=Taklimakanibacter albus TaxID=2800327 RepID=A0ACC5RB29_9HYPH|nr:SRPBCC domain-containing protein [Aestuariivirga sp. YIM B02566]MBK1869891.1 SRPBCC domain-containing protein [Aestuariivirga sp. YIM B02566]
MTGSSRTSRFIKASPDKVYAAFMDPIALLAWMPPGEMTGRMHDFDGREGGGYRMSLFYPASEPTMRGKTAENEDMVDVRFVALEPARRIVEIVTFQSPDPAFAGEMRIEIRFDAIRGGTEVTFICTDIPSGIRPEDNDTGTQQSLAQLARYLEGS